MGLKVDKSAHHKDRRLDPGCTRQLNTSCLWLSSPFPSLYLQNVLEVWIVPCFHCSLIIQFLLISSGPNCQIFIYIVKYNQVLISQIKLAFVGLPVYDTWTFFDCSVYLFKIVNMLVCWKDDLVLVVPVWQIRSSLFYVLIRVAQNIDTKLVIG